MKRPTLVIMVKEPRPGRVKTRLAAGIGPIPATWWFRHQTRSLIHRLRDPRWQIVLAVSPDRIGLQSRFWPEGMARRAQGTGSLGDRMGRQLRSAPPGPVCVIGADIPGIGKPQIARAFKALGAADAVFGPAMDGGYWLVGLRRRRAVPPQLFAEVRWSTEHALTDTVATLDGHSIAYVDRLRDVDTKHDLAMTSAVPRATQTL
ncbi:glycosyltransferase [Aliishimia ponticola]|uniref:Glycosyltransferase n=1 Tax=Aliishimia ponticola TaxID=2499833 RepID=A0A4S4N820_9RHOB|nr:TIGR04282 family arsenosugar biosynthesis glycosyltransferase [Aliishimia ponticola]THH35336.1 glycosyltransferase [Aliishimia ponticola]